MIRVPECCLDPPSYPQTHKRRAQPKFKDMVQGHDENTPCEEEDVLRNAACVLILYILNICMYGTCLPLITS